MIELLLGECNKLNTKRAKKKKTGSRDDILKRFWNITEQSQIKSEQDRDNAISFSSHKASHITLE